MKKYIILIAVIALMLYAFPLMAGADLAIVSSGDCGDGLYWTLDAEGLLTISGTGEISSYPWTADAVKRVVISDGVTRIGAATFKNCPNLTEIHVDSNNKDYSSVDGVLFNKTKTIIHTYPCGKTGPYTIPEGVERLSYSGPDCSFAGCNHLTSLTFPASLAIIGSVGLSNCSRLESIYVHPDNPNFSSIDGVLFDKSQSTIVHYPSNKSNRTYIIPDCVTGIGSGAFDICNNLMSVIIPDSVTNIHNSGPVKPGFYGCDNLTMIMPSQSCALDYAQKYSIPYVIVDSISSLPAGLNRIEDEAFIGSAFKAVSIPDSCKVIGSKAFAYCQDLVYVSIPASVTSISEDAFEGSNQVYLVFWD